MSLYIERLGERIQGLAVKVLFLFLNTNWSKFTDTNDYNKCIF
jgi:hypothetical protein